MIPFKKLVFVFFIAVCSCSQQTGNGDVKNNGPAPNMVEKEKIRQHIDQTLHKYFEEVKANGLTAELNYLDTSEHYFWVPPGYSAPVNYDSVKTILTQRAGDFLLVDNSWDTLTIQVLKEDIATFTGIITSRLVNTEKDTFAFRLIESGVLIKRKSGWKMLNGQTSLINQNESL